MLSQEHSDELVVPSATAEASREVGNRNLENRARVVRQPASQRQVDVNAPGRGRELAELPDLTEVLRPLQPHLIREPSRQPCQHGLRRFVLDAAPDEFLRHGVS